MPEGLDVKPPTEYFGHDSKVRLYGTSKYQNSDAPLLPRAGLARRRAWSALSAVPKRRRPLFDQMK